MRFRYNYISLYWLLFDVVFAVTVLGCVALVVFVLVGCIFGIGSVFGSGEEFPLFLAMELVAAKMFFIPAAVLWIRSVWISVRQFFEAGIDDDGDVGVRLFLTVFVVILSGPVFYAIDRAECQK